MSEEIKVGDQTIAIEARPITLIVPSASMAMAPPIQYPRRVPLTSEYTTYHAMRVRTLHPLFDQCWTCFHANTTPPSAPEVPVDPDKVRGMGSAAVHLMGLIDLTLKLFDAGHQVAWVFPESYMHPGWQVALADLSISLGLTTEEKDGQ